MARVVVVGGGIGGLAAALSVGRAGHQVVVLERTVGRTESGAGIQLAPNAWRALADLGLTPDVVRGVVPVERLEVRDLGTDRTRVALGVDLLLERDVFGYTVAHRGRLHGALRAACEGEPNVTVEEGVLVRGYSVVDPRVHVHVATGQPWEVDVLIGADGLRSTVRAQLLGDGPPEWSGHTAFRAILPRDALPFPVPSDVVTLWGASGGHVVLYPIDDGTRLNVVVTSTRSAVELRAGSPVTSDVVRLCFGTVADRPAAVLAASDAWSAWPLFDRRPDDRWAQGSVALLGDAAHPMLQYAAQGAAMALEDAVELGRAVRDLGATAEALQLYRDRRAPRAGRVQETARWLGREVYHVDQLPVWADQLDETSPEDLLASASWLFDGRSIMVHHDGSDG